MPKLFPLLTAIFTAALLSSSTASAALVSCATSSNPTMCSLCDVFVTGNTIVNYFSGILLPIALVTLTFGGILYLMNRVDQAKSILTASVLGIILSLSAFLIVNITMRALSIPQTDWNTFTCTNQVANAPTPTDGTTFNTTGDGGPKDTVGNPGDITGDPTVTPESVICNDGRDTSAISKTFPLPLTLSCTNQDKIVSAIWRFPSDSNFGSQTLDSRQNLRATGQDTITFTSASNPDQWNEVTVEVTEMNGVTKTYKYGFGGTAAVDEGPATDYCPGRSPDLSFSSTQRFQRVSTGPSADDRASLGNLFRYQSMYAGDTFVIALNVPASDTTSGTFTAGFNYSDIGSNRAGRLVTLSRSKCDFTQARLWANASGTNNPAIGSSSPRNTGGLDFTINETPRSGIANITTGTWYINIKVPVEQCPTGQGCDFVLDYGHITN